MIAIFTGQHHRNDMRLLISFKTIMASIAILTGLLLTIPALAQTGSYIGWYKQIK